MSVIKILPSEIAGRIAAGEVIERPASVVKELVENSIDAGATRIRINIEQGGHKLIQIIDNGCGMDREDAMLCLEAHATSKITESGDVGQIHTLGFRGEALPSISSVSHFQMQTRRPDDMTGTEVIVSNGKIEDVRDCGCPVGTNIRAAYLFGNLPARRKFLKSPATEEANIEETVLLLAMSRPNISFELVLNGQSALRIPSSDNLRLRAEILIGKDAFAAMLPVDYSEDDIHVYGFVSRPGFTRNSRREQRTVINGRAAAAETVFFAIRNAYDTLTPAGRYPMTVLYIDLADERVDVNVHPAKREVRFREPMKVSAVVSAAIRLALRAGSAPIPDAPLPLRFDNPNAKSSKTPDIFPSAPGEMPIIPAAPAPVRPAAIPKVPTPAAPVQPELGNASGQPIPHEHQAPEIRIIAPLGKQYILAESDNGLVVIDILSCKRRIVFERMLANIKYQHVASQQLLLPITLNLSPTDSKMLEKQANDFRALGYDLTPFGGHTWLVTAIPAGTSDNLDFSESLHDILAELRTESTAERQSAIRIAQIAASHSTGSNAELTPQEREQLLKDLLACEMPYTCPSGHPTMLHITNAELTRRFGR